MKRITIEMPDDVDAVTVTYCSMGFVDAWILPSAFQPKDGMIVKVVGDGLNHTCVYKPEGVNGK